MGARFGVRGLFRFAKRGLASPRVATLSRGLEGWGNMMNKKKIINEIEKRRDKLKARGVKKIGLFGSYLKGTQKRGSDIDLLVSFEKENLGKNYFRVLFYLENLLKRKIDLIATQSLRPELNYVKREAVYVEI